RCKQGSMVPPLRRGRVSSRYGASRLCAARLHHEQSRARRDRYPDLPPRAPWNRISVPGPPCSETVRLAGDDNLLAIACPLVSVSLAHLTFIVATEFARLPNIFV